MDGAASTQARALPHAVATEQAPRASSEMEAAPHLGSRSRRCGGAKVVAGSPCSLAPLLEIEEAGDGDRAHLEA
nr:unnamed protein product [Digitaria exilis]